MPTVLVLYAAAVCQMALFAACCWVLATVAGAHVTEVQLGTPPLLRVRRPNVVLRFGPVPLTASCDLLGRVEPVDDPRSWWRLPLARRLLVIVGPWLAAGAVAVACLGPARAARSFVHAAPQLLWTLDLTALVRRFVALVGTAPFAITLGVVLAKATFVNLMPIATCAGGQTIGELRGRAPGAASLVVGMLFMLWVAGRLAYAVVRVLVG